VICFTPADVVQPELGTVLLDLNSHFHVANHVAQWPSPHLQLLAGLIPNSLLAAVAELLLRSGLSSLTLTREDITQLCSDALQIGISGGESLTITLHTKHQSALLGKETH